MIFKKNWKSSRPSPQDPEGTPDLWSLPDRFSPKDTKLAQLSGVVTPVTKIDWHVKRRAVSMNIMFKLPIVHLLWRNLYYVWHRYRYSNVSQVTMWEGFLGWLLLSTGMTDSLRVNLPTLSIVLSKRKSKTRLLMTMVTYKDFKLMKIWQFGDQVAVLTQPNYLRVKERVRGEGSIRFLNSFARLLRKFPSHILPISCDML